MKKLPSPTVRRITPGLMARPARPITAWRSGNHRAGASGCTSRTARTPRRQRRERGQAMLTRRPRRRTRLPGGDRGRAPPTAADERPAPSRAARVSCLHCGTGAAPSAGARRLPPVPFGLVAHAASSGLTRRTSSSGTSANSSETSRPTVSPCATAENVRPKAGVVERRASDRRRNRRAGRAPR